MGRRKPTFQDPRDPLQEPKARELEEVRQEGGPAFQGPVCRDTGAMVELGLEEEVNLRGSVPGCCLEGQADVGTAGRGWLVRRPSDSEGTGACSRTACEHSFAEAVEALGGYSGPQLSQICMHL